MESDNVTSFCHSPTTQPPPPPYQAVVFCCSHWSGQLYYWSWSNVAAITWLYLRWTTTVSFYPSTRCNWLLGGSRDLLIDVLILNIYLFVVLYNLCSDGLIFCVESVS